MHRKSLQKKKAPTSDMIILRGLVTPQIQEIKIQLGSINSRMQKIHVSDELETQIGQLQDVVKFGVVNISEDVPAAQQTLERFQEIQEALEKRSAQFKELYTKIDRAMQLLELEQQDELQVVVSVPQAELPEDELQVVASIPQAELPDKELVIPQGEDDYVCGYSSEMYIAPLVLQQVKILDFGALLQQFESLQGETQPSQDMHDEDTVNSRGSYIDYTELTGVVE